MRLDILNYEDLITSTGWRNNHMETLRTPIMLNSIMQNDFYENVICNRKSEHRYWALKETRKELKEKSSLTWDEEVLVGVGGLTNISWENRNAEISLIIDDKYHRQGLGEKAVELLLDQAFNYMNLENVYGEVYTCNETGLLFWREIVKEYSAYMVYLDARKYWQGEYWKSMWFNINKGDI